MRSFRVFRSAETKKLQFGYKTVTNSYKKVTIREKNFLQKIHKIYLTFFP